MKFTRFAAALALCTGMLGAAPAQAQGCGPSNPNCIVTTMPPGDASNRAASDAFVQQAISPFSPPGGSNGQIQYNNNGDLGGFTASGDATINTGTGAVSIQPNAVTTPKIADGNVTNAKLAAGAANTVKGSVNGTTTSDLAVASCSAAYSITQWLTGTGWQCGINPVLPSRAVAATLNLSAFSTVKTLGYSSGGDGGGATFQKIAGSFIDTRILTGAITGNGTSGCTNGTYRDVELAGGSGRRARATVVVSGNIITAVTVGGQSTAGYAASDVLTISSTVPGCSGAKTWTVSTVTTPTGSFTDFAGNKWQINYPASGLDARSMGVKFDWDGADGTATDNWATLQNALSFAMYPTSTIVDLGGAIGGQVNLVKGTAMVGCGSSTPLVSPYGVKTKGQGNYVSVIKFCDTYNVNSDMWDLCDRETHASCFDSILEDFQIFVQRDVVGAPTRSVVYTNNAQHEAGMRNMVIFTGACGRGATYETGFGGTTYIIAEGVEFKGGKDAASCGGVPSAQFFINMGTTNIRIRDLNISGLSASFNGPRTEGLVINGGFVTIEGIHTEQVINPVTVAIPTSISNGQIRVRGVIGGVDCVGMFTLTSANTPGNFMLGPPNAVNGCTRLVTNAQPAGVNLAGPVLVDTIFNP